MDKKAVIKMKKNVMQTWAAIGGCSMMLVVLTLLSLIKIIPPIFSPVTGIFIPLLVAIASFMQVKAYYKENTLHFDTAAPGDKEEVFQIFEKAKDGMLAQGIDQWDDLYPTINDIGEDISKGELTKVTVNGKIIAVYTVNKYQDTSYKFGDFTDVGDNFVVLHRLCLHPDVWQAGYAPQILAHIDETVKKEGVLAIRLDVFTKNPRALKLYENNGYVYVGDAYYRKGKFLLMEKTFLAD